MGVIILCDEYTSVSLEMTKSGYGLSPNHFLLHVISIQEFRKFCMSQATLLQNTYIHLRVQP